jgi:hypothetical protein
MAQSIVKTYSTAGTYTLYVPLDVTSISVELWGAAVRVGQPQGRPPALVVVLADSMRLRR